MVVEKRHKPWLLIGLLWVFHYLWNFYTQWNEIKNKMLLLLQVRHQRIMIRDEGSRVYSLFDGWPIFWLFYSPLPQGKWRVALLGPWSTSGRLFVPGRDRCPLFARPRGQFQLRAEPITHCLLFDRESMILLNTSWGDSHRASSQAAGHWALTELRGSLPFQRWGFGSTKGTW